MKKNCLELISSSIIIATHLLLYILVEKILKVRLLFHGARISN